MYSYKRLYINFSSIFSNVFKSDIGAKIRLVVPEMVADTYRHTNKFIAILDPLPGSRATGGAG